MKKLLVIYVLGVMAMLAGLQAAKAGTIALWTFEDGTVGAPASTITDSAGTSNGTANNGPIYVDGIKTGYGNQGLSFNGTNQNVFIPSTSGGPLELTGSFTIEVGLINASTGGFALFMGGTAGGKDPYYIAIGADGNVNFQMYFDDTSALGINSGAGAISVGELQHIAAVFDTSGVDNEMRLYVDSTLVASALVGSRVAGYDDPSNLWLGSINDGAFGWYNGVLADVRISDEALGTESFFPVPEPGMVALFGIGLIGLGMARRRR